MPDEQRRHRGGIDRETLEALVAEGLTQRQIAARLGCAQATVRWWLQRHGLRTTGRPGRRPPLASWCEQHPGARHFLDSRGTLRCRGCEAEKVARRRRRVKQLLVDEAGGACVLCGYARCTAALQFHHRDPSQKRFAIANDGRTAGIEVLREEAAKCVLLCANCHAEVEAGLATLPATDRG